MGGSDPQFIGKPFQDGTGGTRYFGLDGSGFKYFEALIAEEGMGSRPWRDAPDKALQGFCLFVPIDEAVVFGEHRGIGRQAMILADRSDRFVGQPR